MTADHAASVAAAVEAYRDAVLDLFRPKGLVLKSRLEIINDIRAIPLPASDALAERDARMRREGMEALIAISELAQPDAIETGNARLMREAWNSVVEAAMDAIRARAGQEGE